MSQNWELTRVSIFQRGNKVTLRIRTLGLFLWEVMQRMQSGINRQPHFLVFGVGAVGGGALTLVNSAGRHITTLVKKKKKGYKTQMEFNLCCCTNVLLYHLTRAHGGTKTLVSSSVFLGSGD